MSSGRRDHLDLKIHRERMRGKGKDKVLQVNEIFRYLTYRFLTTDAGMAVCVLTVGGYKATSELTIQCAHLPYW